MNSKNDDFELPDIYKKGGRVGVQKVSYDPRYDNREYKGGSHKYLAGSENNRKPSLMINPRIISHKYKESISSRGNTMESLPPPSSKGISPSKYKVHPYKNLYSIKNTKLHKLKGLPPASKYSGSQFIHLIL